MRVLALAVMLAGCGGSAGAEQEPPYEWPVFSELPAAGAWVVDPPCAGTLVLEGPDGALQGTLTCGALVVPVAGFRTRNYLDIRGHNASTTAIVTGTYYGDRIEAEMATQGWPRAESPHAAAFVATRSP
jgi:hypothetical protein